jgi:hypothetical protein
VLTDDGVAPAARACGATFRDFWCKVVLLLMPLSTQFFDVAKISIVASARGLVTKNVQGMLFQAQCFGI